MALRPGDDYDRDIMDIIPERYDADADSHQARAGHRLRSYLTIGVAVVAVGTIVAAGLHFVGGKRGAGMGVPVIKADDKPIKIRPDDRGGMQVPNQDKLVYERMEQGAEADAKVERLMPAAEAPKAPPRQPAAVPEPPVQIPLQPAIAPTPTPTPAAPVAAAAKPAAAPPKLPEAAPPKPAPAPKVAATEQVITPSQVASVPVTPPPTPAPVAKAPSGGGDYVIQLGAVRAQDLAEKEWARIQRTNADLLGGLRPDIVRVELEGKGVFWRVRAAPLSETDARRICAELAQRSQGCIVGHR
jgi:hypothetical protein